MSVFSRTTLRVPLLAFALLALAACGGGEATPTATPGGQGTPAPGEPTPSGAVSVLGPGCDLLTDEQLLAGAQFTVERERERDTSEVLASCEWRGTHATQGTGVITVRVWASGGAATLDTESGRLANTFGTFPPYSGIGDRGAIAHSRALYVLVGDRLFFVEARFSGDSFMPLQETVVQLLIDSVP